MKYFYATYESGVHSIFKHKDVGVKYGFYEEHSEIPWDDIEKYGGGLYEKDYIQQSVIANGYIMGGPGGRGFMVVMLDYDTSNYVRSTSKEVYDACIERIKPLIREEKIKSLI